MICSLTISLRPSRAGVPLVAMLSILASIPLAGCAAVGWLAAQTPPDDIEAKFEMPAEKVILVLVDDPAHLVDYAPIKYDLTKRVNERLEELDLAKQTVSYSRLMRLVASTNDFNNMSIAEIGKKLSADLVLYVQIEEFQLKNETTSTIWQGKLGTAVRVVSVKEGRLWPKDLIGGYPVKGVETPAQESGPFSQFGQKLSRQMADEMADNIVKLFYKHKGLPRDALPPRDPSVEP
jgi:hypothetical protein